MRQRSLFLAANLLDMAQANGVDACIDQAREILDSGQAWRQFQRIAKAQGGLKTLPKARFQHIETADRDGVVTAIDNRRLARVAKLAGAPTDPAAGLRLAASLGEPVTKGQPLFTLFSESQGEQDYALAFYRDNGPVFTIGESS